MCGPRGAGIRRLTGNRKLKATYTKRERLIRHTGQLFRPTPPLYMYVLLYCTAVQYYCMYTGGVGVYSVYSAKRPHVDSAKRPHVHRRSERGQTRMLTVGQDAVKRPHVDRRSERGQAPAC